jgi:hypothetical protein
MTVRERVLASRLIQKIDDNESYARQIGLSYAGSPAGDYKANRTTDREEEKKH